MGNLTIGTTNGFHGMSGTQANVASAFDNVTVSSGAMTIDSMSFMNEDDVTLRVTESGVDVTKAAIGGGCFRTDTDDTHNVNVAPAFGVVYLIQSGVYVYNSNASSGATIAISLPTKIVNSGYLVGCGGTGADKLATAGAGQPAIFVAYDSVTVVNNSGAIIAGGGGGGGSGGTGSYLNWVGGGGGAGGGLGGRRYRDDDKQTINYAAGGGPGEEGDDGSIGPSAGNVPNGGGAGGEGGYLGDARVYWGGAHGGAGGGMIFPGTGGTGAGGADGGSGTSAGAAATNTTYQGGGGGGWGASGGNSNRTGTASNGAILNPFGETVTLTNNGTIYGSY